MTAPALFALPPGVDFAAELARGLRARMAGQPPLAMARVLVIVNSPLLRSRLTECLAASGPMLLPRMLTPEELAEAELATGTAAAPVPALRRLLQLQQLVAGLIAAAPELAPAQRLQALSQSLADLLDELHAEGIAPTALASLEMAEHAAHWARMQRFLALVAEYVAASGAAGDAEARLAQACTALGQTWAVAAPGFPIVMAGSTGSRGSVARLMAAVAGLAQGAVVLPGFDFDMGPRDWAALGDSDGANGAEDHPQARLHALLQGLGASPADVRPWTAAAPPDPARNALLSLSLRPAPVTDLWRAEGPRLGPATAATRGLTLIEAPHPRAEALAIALCLRKAAEDQRRAVLITPDRALARQVTAALDRWRIRPDDSAGIPLNQSPPGRLVRLVAGLRGRPVALGAVLSLLKHPLVQAGPGRGDHLRLTRLLELRLRRHGPAFPDAAALLHWANLPDRSHRSDPQAGGASEAAPWASWLGRVLEALGGPTAQETARNDTPLADHLADLHRILALLAGTDSADAPLWQEDAGAATAEVLRELEAEAAQAGPLSAVAFSDLLGALLAARSVREGASADPLIAIRGTREARLHEADLVILGGLVEGVWPAIPAPDPWLSRPMRRTVGLPLPERRIGLAAHDFQQAAGAREVVLTRALRDSDAETVPSRWLNRLVCLLEGLGASGGPEALAQMRAQGNTWLALAEALETPQADLPRAPRPAPMPPAHARPKALSVTEIQTLIRDPYAIYARHVLGLRPLEALSPSPDARLRGIVLHAILEGWLRARPEGGDTTPEAARARLLAIADQVLAREVAWPSARLMWRARLMGAAEGLAAFDGQTEGSPVVLEASGRWQVPGTPLRLTGRPDRIDQLPDGTMLIVDYKTGQLPSPKEMAHFDKQLPVLAVMLADGAFSPPGVARPGQMAHVRVADPAEWRLHPVDDDMLAETRTGLTKLIARYLTADQGFAAARALRSQQDRGPYDQLARRGEWDTSDRPVPIRVGRFDGR